MQRGHAAAAAVIAARPSDVYAILADYRHTHPQILPKPYFRKLAIERGGVGAGTIIHIEMRVLGRDMTYHQLVSEPEPGRVLVEKDMQSDLATTFTVTPIADGTQTHLEIATDWTARPGIVGWNEMQMTRLVLRSIYRKELKQLASYLQQNDPAVSNA